MATRAPSTTGDCSSDADAILRGLVDLGDANVDEIANFEQRRRRAACPGNGIATKLDGLLRRRALSRRSAKRRHDSGNDVVFGNRLTPALVAVGVDVVALRDDVRLVAPVTAPLVDEAEAALDRTVRGPLQPDIHAGMDRQPVLVECFRAVFLLEILADFFGEERRHRSERLRLPADDDRLFLEASACSCVMYPFSAICCSV